MILCISLFPNIGRRLDVCLCVFDFQMLNTDEAYVLKSVFLKEKPCKAFFLIFFSGKISCVVYKKLSLN